MKTKIITVFALLTILVDGCQKQSKIGEAFVVLKSGEVIYMADMEVFCLKPSFKNDFNAWRAEYESQDKSIVREIETGNPTVKAELKEIDDSIAELNTKISGMSGDEKRVSDSLVSAIESERDKIVAEMAKKNDVREEYKQIVEPIDKRIKELEVEADKIKQEQKALTTETIQKINAYIVESKLTIPKLKLDDDGGRLFSTTSERTYDYSSIGEPERRRPYPYTYGSSSSPFLVERKPHEYNGSDWIFLENVPSELEGTQIGPVIKAAYQKWQSIKSRSDDTDGNLRTEKTRKDEQLIPWQNRYGISQSEGQNLVELEKQEKANLARLNEQLSVLKTGGTEAQSLVQEEIRTRISKLNESLDSLNQHRREFLQDATEKARHNLKVGYMQKFYELIKKDAIAAVRTGSKGDFIVSGETAYLYAQSQRDNGEKLAWLIRVDPSSPKIKMSVSNTASAGGYGDFDEYWMFHWILTD
jgi:hypothetical protein